MTLRVYHKIFLDVFPVALSQIANTKLDLDKKFDFIYLKFFMKRIEDTTPQEFIRSPIFNLNAFGKKQFRLY